MAKTPETKIVKMKLDQLLRIKEDLESDIKKQENLMRKNNSRPDGEEAQINFGEVKDKYELELDQLLFVKEAIRYSNATLDKDAYANDHYIYALSNLNRRKAFLNSLTTFEGKKVTVQSGGKEVKYVAKYRYKDVEKELKGIEKQIRELEDKLSSFNHSVDASVVLYTELGLA
jgi:hypothetical protein